MPVSGCYGVAAQINRLSWCSGLHGRASILVIMIMRTTSGLGFFAIGPSEILCDWVHVDNLVHSLVLAAHGLVTRAYQLERLLTHIHRWTRTGTGFGPRGFHFRRPSSQQL